MVRENREKPADQKGFTLIELLVVIVILGILAAVVVFAVQGTGDKGAASAAKIDVRTIRTAEEAYRAKFGGYTDEAGLVSAQLLSEQSQHDVVLSGDPGTASAYYVTSPSTLAASQSGDGSVPNGGTIRVPGSNSVGNVTGNNFVNPAVTSSGTSHPNVEYMFNGLLRWGENNTPQPDLAQSFTISPDQQTATFTLRSGMVWHNNTPILNSDVKFTMEEALFKYHSRTGPSMVPALGGSGGGTTSANVPGTAITLPSSGVVQFNFVRPYPTLLRQMNVTEAPILPENVYGPCRNDGAGPGTDNINTSACPPNNPTSDVDFPADTATNKSPVGSGPFRFKRRDTAGTNAARLVFINRRLPGGVGATPYHFPGLPFADNLIQVPTADTANALIANTIDVGTPANNRILPIVSPQTTAEITTANGYTLADVPRGTGGGNCITTFSFHLWQYGSDVNVLGGQAANTPYNNELFGDPTLVDPDGAGPLGMMQRGKVVRRAISMAIDRTALFNSLDFGKGRVPDSPYHSKLPPYQAQSSMPGYDPATAATWLDNAGWPVSGSPAIRRANFTTTMPGGGVVPGTPLAWQVRRVTGAQDNFYVGMRTQLAAAPVSIDVAAGSGNHAQVAADGSTNTTGALVAGGAASAALVPPGPNGRNYDMLSVSYCNGDDPVIGVRRQYHSDGIPASGLPSNFTNPAGVRSTTMDGFWDTAFGANYTSKHQQVQAMSADDAYQIYWDETSTTRAWKSRCAGFNNFNTGLYVETGGCAS
jgi:peptide/nickel transport system substrate-binding protein